MGIWDRFTTMIRSNLNDLISRAENPEKMLNQLIDDMRVTCLGSSPCLTGFKRFVAQSVAPPTHISCSDWKGKGWLSALP